MSAETICSRVASVYGLSFSDLRARTRVGIIAEARRIACYLVRRITGMSYPAIARLLGRHHTTVLFAVRSVSDALERWPGGSTALALAQAEEACS